MITNKTDDFTKGYMCAVATLIKQCGDDTVAKDLYNCMFMKPEELERSDIEPCDLEVLMLLAKDIQRRRNMK